MGLDMETYKQGRKWLGHDPIRLVSRHAASLRRLRRLFMKGADGRRPVLDYHPKLAGDPQFRDYVLFHEYFHGDTGRGVGASHQTGWTGLVAKLLQPRRGARLETN